MQPCTHACNVHHTHAKPPRPCLFSPLAASQGGRERYVFFSFPHVAQDSTGEMGSISRPGRAKKSCACGALLKCLAELKAEGVEAGMGKIGTHDPLEPEYSILKARLARRIKYENVDVSKLDLPSLTKVRGGGRGRRRGHAWAVRVVASWHACMHAFPVGGLLRARMHACMQALHAHAWRSVASVVEEDGGGRGRGCPEPRRAANASSMPREEGWMGGVRCLQRISADQCECLCGGKEGQEEEGSRRMCCGRWDAEQQRGMWAVQEERKEGGRGGYVAGAARVTEVEGVCISPTGP